MAFEKSRFVADVVKHEHANMDSFPFRYGIHFQKTVQLDLFNCRNFKWQEKDKRFEVEANFVGNNGVIESGFFIILYTNYPNPKVKTVIRKDIDTEYHLSALLRGLREEGNLTPEDLLNLHPKYLSGEANTFYKLSKVIHQSSDINVSKNNLNEIIANADKEYKDLLERMKKTQELNIKLEDDANAALSLVNEAVKTINLRDDEIRRLEKENAKLAEEIEMGKSKGSQVNVEKPMVLVNVETNVHYRGSYNTILILEDGTKRYIKVSTFDKDLQVTKKAQSLIGKKIKVTSWDPVNEPGKWSKQGYFRNIYEYV